MMAFLVQRARASQAKEARVALALAHALAWPAVAYTLYLLFVMVFQLHTLCLFCLTLDTVNVAALVLTAVAARAKPQELLAEAWTALDGPGKRPTLIAGGLGAAVLAVALGGHSWLRASLEAEARAAVTAAPVSSASGEPDEPVSIDDIIARPGPRKLPTKRWEVPVDDDDASVGPKDAKVTIVQFADFQCSFCRKLEQSMAAIRKTYATQARFVFKHYPMNPRCNPMVKNEKHSHACDAAAAGECARRQGKFWPMHDMLYDRQTHLDRPSLDADAAELGLDGAAYAACMSDPTVGAAIAKDASEGASVKVTGTPRTYINGRLFSGVLSEDLLDYVIRIELGQVTGKDAETYAPKPE
jgi:protein-disulfide isomerase